MEEKASKDLAPDKGVTIPRLSLSETGLTGLRMTNGQIIEEANRVFQYPNFLTTVPEMKTDPTIAASLSVYRMMIAGVKWHVKPPENATPSDKSRAKFLQSNMHDMEISWSQFISEVSTYLEYGFSVQEKVYRRRLTRNNSKYNDGLIGLRKIANRPQDTIRHWNFSEDGRELVSIGQSMQYVNTGQRYNNIVTDNGVLTIPRSKLMIFSADSIKGNPEGKSILKAVYLPYKQLSMLKDQLMLGVSKDLSSIPIMGIPPRYMDEKASADEKLVYESYKTMVNNVAAGTQRGIIVPLIYDPETNMPLFKFELLEAKGNSKFDLSAIIKQLQNDIFVALSTDVITFGSDVNGSFSIKDTKTNLCAMAVQHRLNEIKTVLNTDLIPQLYALNGWSQENLPTFEYGDIADVDSEAFSKLVQRVASVGLLEIDRDVLNKIRDVMGVDELPLDTPVDRDNLTGASSSAGKGMEVGRTGEGTAKIGGESSKTDKSTSNADNAA